MATDDWIKKSFKIQQIDREQKAYQAGVNQGMQIAAHPSDPYKADKYEREYLDGLYKNLQIKKEAGKDPSDVFKDGIQGEFDLSKGPVLPEFKPMGPVIKGVRKGVLSPEENKIKQQLQIGPQANMKDSLQRENVGGTLRDMMLPLLIKEYGKDGSGGYKNPGALLSGMKKLAKNLPANNIRRLQDSGHMTVPDPDGSGRLKIIDSLGPQAQVPANNIRSTGPLWRTRPKEGTGHREFYDPVTGMSMDDFKA